MIAGLTGAGKSTVARALARHSNVPYFSGSQIRIDFLNIPLPDGVQLAKTESELARIDAVTAETRLDVNRVIDLARKAAESYRDSPDQLRREWNYARYESFEIDVEDGEPDVALAHRTPIFEGLRTAIIPRPRSNTKQRRRPEAILCCVGGSRVELLVEIRGLEPRAFCMPCKRSSQLSYIPLK